MFTFPFQLTSWQIAITGYSKERGEWVSKTGETGRYGVVAKGHYNNQGLKMTNSYKHGGKSWTMTIFLKKKSMVFMMS